MNVAALGKMMTMMQPPATSQPKTQNAQQPGSQQSVQQGNQPQTFQQAWNQTLEVVKNENPQAFMNDMKALANVPLSPCHAPAWNSRPPGYGPPVAKAQAQQNAPNLNCPPQAPGPGEAITLAEAAQDLAISVTNLKWDSDWLRSHTHPSQTVAQELVRMNGMLAAIPPMALEMRKMTIAMGAMTSAVGSMTNSVGSTMGRFGSMWPF